MYVRHGSRLAIALALSASALTLVLAPAASGATFYSNFGPGAGLRTVDPPTQYVAVPFVATANGLPRFASFYAQTYAAQTTQISVSIYTDAGGQPGTAVAAGTPTTFDDTSDSTPTCTTLTPLEIPVFGGTIPLNAGQAYWAVFRNHTAHSILVPSVQGNSPRLSNDGAAWGAPSGLPFAFRIDDTSPCVPEFDSIPNPNPDPNAELGDMYATPGGTAFQTLLVGNTGLAPLKLKTGTFSGPSASMFKVLDGEPNGAPPGKAFPFGTKTVGAGPGAHGGAGVFLYVVCAPPAGTPDGELEATFTLTTDDPDEGSVSWPVWCLIDRTPPSVEFPTAPDGRSGWFVTRPAQILARGVDPESGNRVKHIFCTDNGAPTLDWPNGSVAQFAITPDGTHNLSCQATDVANNTSAPGLYTTTVKVDGTPPQTTTGEVGPPAVSDEPAFAASFTGSDAMSGLGEFECSLDGGPYELCTSPASRSGLGNGRHTFDVRARDVAGNYDPTPAQWIWEVNAPAPLAADDAATATEGGPLDIDVLANDVEPRGVPLHIVLDSDTSEMGGDVSVAGSRIQYIPPVGFAGTDRFRYRAVNANGVMSAAATVTVEVVGNSRPGDPASAACDKAKKKLAKAKAKLRKLQQRDASKKAIDKAKAKVEKRRKRVKAACSGK